MAKEGYFEKEAIVLTALPNAHFRVKLLESDVELLAHVSGKIRKNNINILCGDVVKVEISSYDLTKCRITFRIKKNG